LAIGLALQAAAPKPSVINDKIQEVVRMLAFGCASGALRPGRSFVPQWKFSAETAQEKHIGRSARRIAQFSGQLFAAHSRSLPLTTSE
jgi:hypothetical protein